MLKDILVFSIDLYYENTSTDIYVGYSFEDGKKIAVMNCKSIKKDRPDEDVDLYLTTWCDGNRKGARVKINY